MIEAAIREYAHPLLVARGFRHRRRTQMVRVIEAELVQSIYYDVTTRGSYSADCSAVVTMLRVGFRSVQQFLCEALSESPYDSYPAHLQTDTGHAAGGGFLDGSFKVCSESDLDRLRTKLTSDITDVALPYFDTIPSLSTAADYWAGRPLGDQHATFGYCAANWLAGRREQALERATDALEFELAGQRRRGLYGYEAPNVRLERLIAFLQAVPRSA